MTMMKSSEVLDTDNKDNIELEDEDYVFLKDGVKIDPTTLELG